MSNFSFIKSSYTIGVMAPSSFVEREDIEASQKTLEALGYFAFIHEQTFSRLGQLAGTAQEKADALNALYKDPAIDAIWAAGGGNGALEILHLLDFEVIKNNPKPLIGFSDVTVLLNIITAQTGVQNWHGPVFKQLHAIDNLEQRLAILSGDKTTLHFHDAHIVNGGPVKGTLVGGNLSMVQYLPSLAGLDYFDDKILFLEDTGEEISRVDRILQFLKACGVTNRINGLILGDFSALTDSGRAYGFDINDVIEKFCHKLTCPIITHAGFGHCDSLPFFPVGRDVHFDFDARSLSLLQGA